MLRLQSGKFDHADRQFNSVAGSWTSAVSSHTDVRELIPQFYDADAEICDESWLANAGAGARPVAVPGYVILTSNIEAYTMFSFITFS